MTKKEHRDGGVVYLAFDRATPEVVKGTLVAPTHGLDCFKVRTEQGTLPGVPDWAFDTKAEALRSLVRKMEQDVKGLRRRLNKALGMLQEAEECVARERRWLRLALDKLRALESQADEASADGDARDDPEDDK